MSVWSTPFVRSRCVPAQPLRVALGALAGCFLLLSSGGAAHGQSCGHYVKRLGPDFVPGKAAAEKVAAQSHDLSATSPCGCNGAECRQAPREHLPLAPATPERFTGPQDVTTVAAAHIQLEVDSSWLWGDASSRPSRGYPLETNRPPSA